MAAITGNQDVPSAADETRNRAWAVQAYTAWVGRTPGKVRHAYSQVARKESAEACGVDTHGFDGESALGVLAHVAQLIDGDFYLDFFGFWVHLDY